MCDKSDKELEIIIVRHGQTEQNKEGILQGQLDTELNEMGIKQAREIALRLKDIKFDKIYSSTLKRAVDTCEEINKYHNIEVEYKPELRERNYGSLQGEKANLKFDLKQEYWEFDNSDNAPNGGESLHAFFNRVTNLLQNIINSNSKNGGRILIIAHVGVVIAAEYYFKGLPRNKDFFNCVIENCGYINYNSSTIDPEIFYNARNLIN